MTNDEFLQFIFKDKPTGSHTFTASFPGDPAAGDYRFNPFLPAEHNNFFCVSSLTDTRRRRPQEFAALHVLVVDDVGTKVGGEFVMRHLGVPSYIIETSADNYQWGYVLDQPVTDRAMAEGMVQALCKLTTSDVAGVNRLVRLPIGRNGKPGKNDFQTVLFSPPTTRRSVEDMIARLKAEPVTPETLDAKPFLPMSSDPVLQAITDKGLTWRSTRDPGRYEIQCPWLHEHTGGRDDGTAYFAPAGFKCFHGHCADKTFADLRKWLGLSEEAVDEAINTAAMGIQFHPYGASITYRVPEAVVPVLEAMDEKRKAAAEEWMSGMMKNLVDPTPAPQHPWSTQTVRDLFTEDGQLLPMAERDRLYPRHWLFDGLIPMSTPWAIAGEGGLGKSRLGLALCMSVATGIPLGDSFVPDKTPSPVLFLTQEDDACDRAHRFATQYERLCERDPRWRSDRVAHALMDNLFVPTLSFGQQLDDRFVASVGAFAGQCGPLRLVLFDPLVLFWDHEDEQHSINSAAGVISTFRKLIQIARQHSEHGRWSCGMMHHMNKTGKEFYGSVMIHSHVRTLFTMTRVEDPPDEEAKYATLTVAKTNSTNKAGHEYLFELDKDTAAIYPREPFAFETTEHKLARLITEPINSTHLIKCAVKAGLNRAEVKSIGLTWANDPAKAAVYGVRLGKFGRFEPMGEMV